MTSPNQTTAQGWATTSINLDAPGLQRWQVVQSLLELYRDPRYLEVGVSRGGTFRRVEAARKVAVDPKFLFDWEADQKEFAPATTFHQIPSDEYFGTRDPEEFDVIFLDGLHTFEQTLRDLLNALERLAPGGVILIDDIRPTSYHASLPDQDRARELRFAAPGVNVEDASWMGDVYRLVWFIDAFCQGLTYRTIDNNHGQAVVWRERRESVTDRPAREVADLSYADYMLNPDVMQRFTFGKILADVRKQVIANSNRSR